MAFPTLGVTSPHTKGQRVAEAQWLLNGHNRLKQDFYKGSFDGEFGPLVGAACVKAKYWLGYPTKDQQPVFGEFLRSLLVNADHPAARNLPVTYKLRRAARVAAAKRKPKQTKGQKAVAKARTHLGYREKPNNNTIFGEWYGMNFNPWCAFFVSKVITDVGGKFHESYCPTILNKAQTNRDGLSVTNEPEAGDVFVVDWDGNGVYDHTGFFVRWIDREHGTFETVEGNTLPPGGAGNQSNGGGCYTRVRSSKTAKFVFIKWA